MNMIKKYVVMVPVIATLFGAHSEAATRIPVRALPGYKCMALDGPEKVMMDFQHPISLKVEPRDDAAAFSPAAGILAVDNNTPEVNGYVKSMNMVFRAGWVSTKWMKPYSEVHPGVTCAPYVMSDGKLGFVFGKE
jgi:hypothetical protein